MAPQQKPDPQRTLEEWPAVARQSEALKKIDKLIKSDEPAGEKLKEIVKDHSEACNEIKEKLAGHKQDSIPPTSPLSE
jgi:hypothetical protein